MVFIHPVKIGDQVKSHNGELGNVIDKDETHVLVRFSFGQFALRIYGLARVTNSPPVWRL